LRQLDRERGLDVRDAFVDRVVLCEEGLELRPGLARRGGLVGARDLVPEVEAGGDVLGFVHARGPEDSSGGALAVYVGRYLRRQRCPGPSVDVSGVKFESNLRAEGPVVGQIS
jgi:hypothetical protein